jgi:hypothetical protein
MGAGRGARRAGPRGPAAGLRHAIWTSAPVRDLGLVDLVAVVVRRRETRSGADGAIDIDDTAADATDQMMVIVADAILESRRRTSGLNPTNQALGDQHAECVVDRLKRDGADLGPHRLGNGIGSDVRPPRDGAQNSQSLRRHLDTALSKEVCRVGRHTRDVRSHSGVIQIFDTSSIVAYPLLRFGHDFLRAFMKFRGSR